MPSHNFSWAMLGSTIVMLNTFGVLFGGGLISPWPWISIIAGSALVFMAGLHAARELDDRLRQSGQLYFIRRA